MLVEITKRVADGRRRDRENGEAVVVVVVVVKEIRKAVV